MLALDVARFGLGAFTAVPVRAPRETSQRVSVPALVLAPVWALPLGVAVAVVLAAGRELGLGALPTATAAVALLALGCRAFHLDGLADTADALASGYDRERSLAVMKRGDVGPAGVVTLLLVLLAQVGAADALLQHVWGPVLAGVLVCVSRGAAAVPALRGVVAARPEGLAASYAGTVPPTVLTLLWLVLAAVVTGAGLLVGLAWWRGPLAVLLALLVVVWLVRRATVRFGGVTGDTYGAAVELALAVLLVALA